MHVKKWLVWSAFMFFALLVWTGSLYAQSEYNLSWFSVDGGGALSEAGGYTLRGVKGQADAGTLNNADYTLTGGVLAISVPTEPPDQTPGSTLFMPKLNR